MATGDPLLAAQLFPEPSHINAWINGGQVASTTSIPNVGTTDAYWLPIWSGEVLHAYDQYNIFEPMVTTETIESGTTKRFPITGTVGHRGIWEAGTELLGDSTATAPGYFDISLDQRPMAAFFELDDIALMLTQWDYRAELARQAGLQLSYIRDKQIACMIAQGAFSAGRGPQAATLGGMNRSYADSPLAPNATFNFLGNRKASAENRTNAALLFLDYLERYMVRLSEIDATLTGVYAAVTPQAFQDIRALGIARISGDLFGGAGRPFFGAIAEAGGLGVPLANSTFGLGESLTYQGVTIVKSNHLLQLQNNVVKSAATARAVVLNSTTGLITPGTNTGSGVIGDLGDQKYNMDWSVNTTNLDGDGDPDTAFGASVSITVASSHDFRPIKAIIWQKSAVCSMRLQGMKVETVKDVRRGTFFTVASIMGGAGILRPELCGAIQGLEDNT